MAGVSLGAAVVFEGLREPLSTKSSRRRFVGAHPSLSLELTDDFVDSPSYPKLPSKPPGKDVFDGPSSGSSSVTFLESLLGGVQSNRRKGALSSNNGLRARLWGRESASMVKTLPTAPSPGAFAAASEAWCAFPRSSTDFLVFATLAPRLTLG